MTTETAELFDTETLKKLEMGPAGVKAFCKVAKPIMGADFATQTCVHGYAHPDGRILITRAGKLSQKSKAKTRDTLHLMLYTAWYNAVLSGEKHVEYRRITQRWTTQIWDRRASLKTVIFHRGYTATTICGDIVKIDIGPCPYNGWEGDYYRIWFEVKK